MGSYKQVADKFGVEEAQVEELKWAMESTWDQIGYDFVDCCGGESEAYEFYDSEAEMVAEATLDADRIKSCNPTQDLAWVYRTSDGGHRKNCMALGMEAWTATSR